MCLAQEISPDFKKNIIIPILKKASADRCENYGIISLVSHGSKILTHIIYRWMEKLVESDLGKDSLDLREM